MVHENHAGGVFDEPDAILLNEVRSLNVLVFLVSRKKVEDERSAKRHESGGTRMQTRCTTKEVNGQAYGKTRKQQLPFGDIDRQEHDEDQIDVGMHITTQADIVDHKHLKKDECYKTNEIE